MKPTDDYHQWGKAMSFCNKNGVFIYPLVVGVNKLQLCVEKKGKKEIGNGLYTNQNFSEKIKELYLHFYDKLNKKKQ